MRRLSLGTDLSLSQALKIVLVLGSSLLVLAVFFFTQQMILRLSRQVTSTSRVLARFCAQASFPATVNPQLRSIVSEMIGNLDFPIVITDEDGTPRAWRKIDVDPALVPSPSIDSLKAGAAIAPVIRARLERVELRVAELDRNNAPIPMVMPGSQVSMGAVHYGDPPVLERLRWMPLASVGGVVALIAIGLWGLAVIRQSEKRMIWVGMAKETAHQLGTPLSSLMGWTELLRSHTKNATPGDDVRFSVAEIEEVISEMERDIDHLNKVAQRFSRVGSAPNLELQDVTTVVREVVKYMRRRMPQTPGEVEIREHYQPVPQVRLNAELIEWALENLISNALSALDKRPGLIEVGVAARKEGRVVEVVVSDNGRGMSPAERRRAFEPGFTTKRRGWGLGLPLSRRVIDEYHRGRLFISQTAPGRGTSVVVRLPV